MAIAAVLIRQHRFSRATGLSMVLSQKKLSCLTLGCPEADPEMRFYEDLGLLQCSMTKLE